MLIDALWAFVNNHFKKLLISFLWEMYKDIKKSVIFFLLGHANMCF